MRKFLARHWSGDLHPLVALALAFAIYLLSVAALLFVGPVLAPELDAPVGYALLFVWAAINLWAIIGAGHSALRAIRAWRTARLRAVFGLVAAVILIVACLAMYQDISAEGTLGGPAVRQLPAMGLP